MAVGFGTDVDATPATGTSIVFPSITISGSRPAVIVSVGMNTGSESISSISLGSGLTGGTPYRVKKAVTGGVLTVDIWAIPAPSGAGVITVNLSGSVPFQANAALFTDADQTTPAATGDADVQTGTGILIGTPTNLTANDAALGMGANALTGDDPSCDHGPGTLVIYKNNTTNVNASAGYHLGTGGITCVWGTSAANDTMVAVRIAQTAAGGGAETITLDKWFPQSAPNRRRTAAPVASGIIGIRNT